MPYCVALIVLGAYWSGADWAFRLVIWVFLGALFADTIVRTSGGSTVRATDLTLRMLTWPWLFVQIALIVAGFLTIARAQAIGVDLQHTFMVTSVGAGAAGGMFGIPVAHELMHRRSRIDRFFAEALMTLFSYTHFCIEHVEGHHRNVGTRADPATARYGESLYAFLPRTVFGGLANAWRLERARLRKQNRLIWYLVALCGVYAAVAVIFGRWGVMFFALQGAIAVFLIETLNYIEHYGLIRQERDGRPEAVDYRHSWDAGHAVSGWLLFNVSRHSDHHVHPHKGYLSLEGHADAPQLPAGYFSLFVLALFPPLWRKVMDPRLDGEGVS